MALDSIGALASLLATYYFICLTPRAWIVSLAAISLNGYLYWKKGIYAEAVLEGIYFLTTCYGWFNWQSSFPYKEKSYIKKLSKYQFIGVCIFILSLYSIIRSFLIYFTTSTVLNMDSLTAALSLTAQFLMCHKIINTWVLWFITDIIYAFLYFKKDLPFHVCLMFIYTIMAVIGYYSWYKSRSYVPSCI